MTRCHCSILVVSALQIKLMPALLTNTSAAPWSRAIFSANSTTNSSEEMSPESADTLPPRATNASACVSKGCTSVMTT